MKSPDIEQRRLYCYVSAESRIPKNQQLRPIKDMVNARVTQATGTCEREAATEVLGDSLDRVRATVGADKGNDCKQFVEDCCTQRITPVVAQKQHLAIDGRTTRHPGYSASQRVRKRVEEVFACAKTIACLRKAPYRDAMFIFAVAVYDLVRMRDLGHATVT